MGEMSNKFLLRLLELMKVISACPSPIPIALALGLKLPKFVQVLLRLKLHLVEYRWVRSRLFSYLHKATELVTDTDGLRLLWRVWALLSWGICSLLLSMCEDGITVMEGDWSQADDSIDRVLAMSDSDTVADRICWLYADPPTHITPVFYAFFSCFGFVPDSACKVWSNVLLRFNPFFEQLFALRLLLTFVEAVIEIGAGFNFWKDRPTIVDGY